MCICVCGHPGTQRTPVSVASPERSPSTSITVRDPSQQGLNVKLRLFPVRLGSGWESSEEWGFLDGILIVSLGTIGDNPLSGL